MFRIFAVQLVAGRKVSGYMSACCSELLERSDDRYVGKFEMDQVAMILPSLDYEGCELVEVRVERI